VPAGSPISNTILIDACAPARRRRRQLLHSAQRSLLAERRLHKPSPSDSTSRFEPSDARARGVRGGGRARSHCHFVLPPIHSPHAFTNIYSVHLCF
jgi:hypothetical protein